MNWINEPVRNTARVNFKCDYTFTDSCSEYGDIMPLDCGSHSCFIYGCPCNDLYCWHKNIFG